MQKVWCYSEGLYFYLFPGRDVMQRVHVTVLHISSKLCAKGLDTGLSTWTPHYQELIQKLKNENVRILTHIKVGDRIGRPFCTELCRVSFFKLD